MNLYDYDFARKYIEENSSTIKRVELGIEEDWYFTAEPIWEDGEYTEEFAEDRSISGLFGSPWGVPAMRVEYLDGKYKTFDCYYKHQDE